MDMFGYLNDFKFFEIIAKYLNSELSSPRVVVFIHLKVKFTSKSKNTLNFTITQISFE